MDKAREDVPGVAEHPREQPNDPADVRLIGEGCDKAGKVDLRLVPGRRLEANFERFWLIVGSDHRHEALHRRVGAAVAPLLDLAGEPDRRQVRKSRDALTQIVEIGSELVWSANLTWPVGRQLEPAFNVLSYRLRIAASAPSDGRDR